MVKYVRVIAKGLKHIRISINKMFVLSGGFNPPPPQYDGALFYKDLPYKIQKLK